MKNTSEIVYNTLGDIHDESWIGFNEKGNKFTENPDTIIESLNGIFIGNRKYVIPKELGAGRFEKIPLRKFIYKLPQGIFDKKVAGIRATTIEIKSNSHSLSIKPTNFLVVADSLGRLIV